jgi:gliding motility-associated transport system ATP-binding protein
LIEISELYKYYGDRRAIGPVSAKIAQGEIVGLLGLNGAGKTTTLRVLACDLLPTSGTVRVGGLDVVEHPDEVKAKIGYLPDLPPLYGEMRVSEYLSFVARLRGVDRAAIQRHVDDVLELTEIGNVRDDLISSLSHGFRQRVGIAQAVVHRPELVVLDEPISGLDPVQIVEMRALVRSLGGERTVVVSSHILPEISETCDRLLVIRDGEIVASGSEAELSAELLTGMRIDVTVRSRKAGGRAAGDVLRAVDGVADVEATEAEEAGENVASFHVQAERDVRDALCRALITADFELLELRRSERELESVFLELSSSRDGARAKRSKKPADAAAAEAGS